MNIPLTLKQMRKLIEFAHSFVGDDTYESREEYGKIITALGDSVGYLLYHGNKKYTWSKQKEGKQ